MGTSIVANNTWNVCFVQFAVQATRITIKFACNVCLIVGLINTDLLERRCYITKLTALNS